MKKFVAMVLAATMCFSVVGCGGGNKSNVELTDIEQFKCQDSIQTVFDVLGEIEMEDNVYIGECYPYENLNLYGYNGKAIFRVRDDKETISSFECSLKLNKKEFEDVLNQLENKYGKSEKNEYSNQTAYVWEFSEDKAKEIGYNRISLNDYGDKKVVIDFSDEWSMYKDEAYYQHLEEEKKVKVLAQKTYNIGVDTFDFSFGQKGNGDYSFNLMCQVEDKSDAYITHILLNAIMNSDDKNMRIITEDFGFMYTIMVGDGSGLVRSKDVFMILGGDGKLTTVDDYFPTEWVINEVDFESDYGEKVVGFLTDFIENK